MDIAALFALNHHTPEFEKDGVAFGRESACCQTHDIELKQVRHVHQKSSSSESRVGNYLLLANNAVERLRRRGSHFDWSICEDGEFGLFKVLVVSSRSNFRIEGRVEKSVTG